MGKKRKVREKSGNLMGKKEESQGKVGEIQTGGPNVQVCHSSGTI